MKTRFLLCCTSLALAACGGPAAPAETPTLAAPLIVTTAPTLTTLPTAAVVVEGPAATAAPTAVPQPTAASVLGPDTYPADVNPLTGLQVGVDDVERIPLAVKISNFPISARPQFGLAQADLVFEHQAEAGLTRFTAFFLGNDADKIGPVRSARFIDAEIVPAFQAALVTSGSSFGTMDKLRGTAWFQGADVWRLVSEESAYSCPPLCRERPDDMNSLFSSTTVLRQALAEKAQKSGVAAPGRADLRGLAFSTTVPAGTPVTDVQIRFSGSSQTLWNYDPTTGRYLRWQESAPGAELVPHIDGGTEQQLSAANVVLLAVNHQNNFVPEDFRDGGNCGVEIQLWTSGPARVFRDGVMIEGTWVRDASTGMHLQLRDAAGAPIALKPGNTWFPVITLNSPVELNGAAIAVAGRVPDTKTECPVPPTETPDPNALPTVDPLATPVAP